MGREAKIDFSRVLDRLEWSLIESILKNLGFHRIFIS